MDAQTARYPIMRRFDQHFVVENKLNDYTDSITQLSALNRNLLSSILRQEQKVKDLQASLKPRDKEDLSTCRPNNYTSSHDAKPELVADALIDSGSQKTAKSAAILDAKTQLQTSQPTRLEEAGIGQPLDITLTEVTDTSFTLTWDAEKNHRGRIFEVEIQYCCTINGIEKCVQQSCSRWVLKRPIPEGVVRITGLETNNEYRNVSLRFKNHQGWSEFTTPIKRICTSDFAYDFQQRKKQFLYRIAYIHKNITELKGKRSSIPSKQKKLAMDMKKMQHRMMELNNEFERVLAIESDHNIVSSPLLHGSRQAFSKSDLEKQLQKESVMCQKQISQWRAEIYRLDTERSHLSNEIVLASRKLNDRKDLMLRLEDQYFTMQNLRSIGSHQTGDVLQFYVARWRTQRKKRVEIKETLDWLGQYCRRQRLTDAWSKLQVKQRPSRSFESESGGISNKLISTAEASTIDDNTAALGLALELAAAMDEQSSSDGNIDFLHRFTSANHLSIYLPSNDDIIILQKGSFYMQAGNYQPALRCFEHVMSNASSEQYFCGIDEPNRITILSVLYGMLAEVYYKLGKPDMAIVYFNRQLSLSQEIGVEWVQISALFGLGRCYFSKSEIEYAHSLFNKALEAMASMTDSSSSNLSIVYHWLKKCLVNMNQMDRADLIQGKLDEVERDERKEKVEASLSAMGRMKQHLVDLNARKSQVVALEAASATSILLQREKLKKEKLLIEYDENLTKLHESIEKLRDLETQLQLEIDIASSSKKGRIISHLINGAAQEVKTKELITRLQGQLRVVNAKKDESCKESERLRLLIHNTKDEVSSIIERISVEEGPLMQRVLKNNRNYRCMKLNPSNTMRNDVSGCSKGCIELLASSHGQELYLHNVSTGRLESVFTGDREGTHIGEVNGHTKTITSLCWFGKEIYTGGMDCCIIGWCTRTMKKLRVYKGHEGGVNCLCVTSSQIFSGGADKMIILWNKSDGSIIRRVHGHSRGVHHVFGTSIPSSNLIMVSASYGEVFCWKEDISSTPTCHCRLQLPQGNVTALQYGELDLVCGDSTGYLTMFWIESGEIQKSIKVHEGPVSALQVDASKAVTSGQDMVIQVVDIIKGVIIQSLRGHCQPISDVAFDSNCIISLSIDGEICTWEWDQGKQEGRRLNYK